MGVASDHLLSGTWFTKTYEIEPGFHTLEWQYMKYQNLRNDEQEELAAEIDFIRIKGVQYANHECEHCHKGIANDLKNKCLQCPSG
jgi:hypothetical protein